MSWFDWIPSIIDGIGLFADREDASRPDAPEMINLEELARLMMVNTSSPWGGTTYTQGPDGRYTAEYALGEQIEPIFDRMVQRSQNPDQAYQMPAALQSLQEALMAQRLGAVGAHGPSAQPQRTPYAPGVAPTPVPFPASGQAVNNPPAIGQTGRTIEPIGAGNDPGMSNGSGDFGGMTNPAGYLWGSSGPSASSGRSGNDLINDLFPQPLQGSNPSPLEQFGANHAGDIGSAIGALAGIPGLGWLGNYLADQYWQDHQWQSPANLPPSLNDLIDEAAANSPHNMGNLGAMQSPTGEGRQGDVSIGPGSPWSYAFGQGGPWYRNGGFTVFRPSGF